MDISYYDNYKNSKDGFDAFHNEVINMPREKFSDTGLNKMKILSSYLLILEKQSEFNIKLNYKKIMHNIKQSLDNNYIPLNRDKSLEDKYFRYHNSDLSNHYSNRGREFRHLMGLCKVFKLLYEDEGLKIDYDKCKEFAEIQEKIYTPAVRNTILDINLRDNPYIRAIKGIKPYLDIDNDYPLAMNIIKYIYEINRPVTLFEISILLGRVDNCNNEEEIYSRAINFGRHLPNLMEEQLEYFFEYMNWKNEDGSHFAYVSSQEPHFKFKNFIILMEDFGLLEYNEIENKYEITEYSLNLLKEDLPAYIADLEELLSRFDDDSLRDTQIKNSIVNARYEGLTYILEKNEDLIPLLNKRSIENTKYDKNGKRVRNEIVMLFSKISKDYKCDILYSKDASGLPKFNFNEHLFKNEKGLGYCEGHHIIEFSRENGPDVVENIILLDPNTHMLIHHGHPELKQDLYSIIRKNNIVTLETFINMIEKYNCLNKDHIQILHNKGIIDFSEKAYLLNKLVS